MLQYENEMMKEDARALREELEIWKEEIKKQPIRRLNTLVQASIQFEDPLFTEEKDELICRESGVLFKLAGYKVDKMEISSWILAHSGHGGNETLHEEPAKETSLEENLIPKQNLHVDEAL